MARELTNQEDGFLNGKRYLIMDRNTEFWESIRTFLSNENREPPRLPPLNEIMNAHLGRFVGSLKFECLDRLILFGEEATRNAVNQYLAHYHAERPHQGSNNELVVPLKLPTVVDANIESSERIGVPLRSYCRAA